VRVRRLGGFADEVVGVDLMNKAFGPKGSLTDRLATKCEQEGTRGLFAGAYAVFRNPAGHREVNYEDVAEAAEAVQTARSCGGSSRRFAAPSGFYKCPAGKSVSR
jgi:hypothetical protein